MSDCDVSFCIESFSRRRIWPANRAAITLHNERLFFGARDRQQQIPRWTRRSRDHEASKQVIEIGRRVQWHMRLTSENIYSHKWWRMLNRWIDRTGKHREGGTLKATCIRIISNVWTCFKRYIMCVSGDVIDDTDFSSFYNYKNTDIVTTTTCIQTDWNWTFKRN